MGNLRAEPTDPPPAVLAHGYFRDTYGTEVDFLIDHNGRVRLIEAKWAEVPDAADAKQIVKVSGWLGALAADERWIACRSSHQHLLASPPGVRAIDAWRMRNWFANED